MAELLIVFGTRPEAIKLFPVVEALRRRQQVQTRVCVTGQHRELLDQVLALSNTGIDTNLDLMRPGQTIEDLTARLLTGLADLFAQEPADRVIVQGDTSTAVATALAAHHRKIPVSHVEAGLRSGDARSPWPEEVNRRIIGSIADQHFAPTESAADALRREGVDPDTIHVTGNTVIDALFATEMRLQDDPSLASGLDPIAARFVGKRIIVVTAHRRESFGAGLASIARAVRSIAARADVALILPVHPNPEVRAAIAPLLAGLPNVAMIEPLDYPHFVRLLMLAEIVLTDSVGVQEEAPALGKPVLVLRDTTERSEGIAAGTARLVGTDRDRIVAETFALLDDPHAYAAMSRAQSLWRRPQRRAHRRADYRPALIRQGRHRPAPRERVRR